MKLIVDTDTASDDAVALLLAARDSGTELDAVTTVAGNVPLPLATRNALLTLELAGMGGVPVYEGCDRPMARPLSTAQPVHGDDGMGDLGLADPAGRPQPGHAVDVLLDRARARPGEYTLVSLGPLTNLAAALLRDRDLLGRYRHVYCMIGAPDAVGNISATAEFNAWVDPEAAQIVLSAADPGRVTWIGWDVSRRDAVMTPGDQERLLALDSPLASFAHRINRKVAEWARQVSGLSGYDLPDPVAMAVALRPGLVAEHEKAHVRIALGDEARGQSMVDRRLTGPPPNVTLVRRVHEKGFKELLFGLLAQEARV
ncbi:nucleoside hydrolase [Nonomuraea sp. B12E4]|uniref:nucleoside hydrolase n=1 Tax=Nonomuraea sp. B12E4 TaxID=3153564 RepID=UPI00325E7E1E